MVQRRRVARTLVGLVMVAAPAIASGCSHPEIGSGSDGTHEPAADAARAMPTSVPSSTPTMLDASAREAAVLATPPLERGPAPPQAGVRFPFPQNREVPGCTYPAGYRNSDVVAAYDKWKLDTVTSEGAGGHMRIQRHASDGGLELHSTVSEGIGYGMILAVYMNDQTLFDELWKYEQLWLDGNGLMDWYINAQGTTRLGQGGATDADEDMAWALVQADRQWGGSGTLGKPYLDVAKDQIQKIWDHEIFDSKLARAGDTWGDWGNVNISYFAPSYYRVFAKVMGDDKWMQVIKTVYDTIDNALNATNGNQTNGLVPAWCTSDGVPRPAFDNAPTHYQYDSCRTPYRIGLDWCFAKEPRAQAYVAKTSSFFGSIGASKIADGYDLNGTPRPANPGKGSAAFLGPAAVGAMSDRAYLPFINEAYAAVATRTLMAGGAYYEDAWTVLSLLVMTGNFVDFTAL